VPTPISSHVAIQASATLQNRPAAALATIDAVHLDGELGGATIHGITLPDDECGDYNWKTLVIRLNVARDDHESTLVHEIGHLVAIEGFGKGTPVCHKHRALGAWRKAARASETHKRLRDLKKDGETVVLENGAPTRYVFDADEMEYLDYLLEWEELWARTYCQFISIRSGSAAIQGQLQAEAVSPSGEVFTPQWPAYDFVEIELAIEDVLKERGWM
jgi:hypothetical protein